MVNKRADSEWTVRKLIVIILLVIVLFLVVYGIYNGAHRALYENVQAKVDSVLIMFGIKDDVIIKEDECVSYPVSLNLDNGQTETGIFKQCVKYGISSCEVLQIQDGSNYFYSTEDKVLRVQRKDSSYYPVDLNVKNTPNSENLIYYEVISHLYKAYGVDTDKRTGYDISNYIRSDLDNDFGEFSDLLVLYSPNEETYLLFANGLGLVYKDDSIINADVILPLFDHDKDDIIYSGNSIQNALDDFDKSIRNFDDVQYAICEPQDINSIYRNCISQGSSSNSGKLSELLKKIYQENSAYFNQEPKSFDLSYNDVKSYLDVYLQLQRNNVLSGENIKNTVSNNVASINQKLSLYGNTVQINGETYELVAEQTIFDDSKFYPILSIKRDGQRVYFLSFNGAERYYENDIDYLRGDENKINSPLGIYDANQKTEVTVSREFFQSDDENSLDKAVNELINQKC